MSVDALASAALRGLGSEEVEVRGGSGTRRVRGILTGVSESIGDGEIMVDTERLALTLPIEDGEDLREGSIVLARGSRFKVIGSHAFRHGFRFVLQVAE